MNLFLSDIAQAGGPRVSIIIPVLDAAPYLSRCLEAIEAQSYPPDQLEIIVADGGSTDGSQEIVKQFMARDGRVRLVENVLRTAAAGLNAGLEHARGKLIVRVDAHCIIAPDYVARCVSLLEDMPEVGDVGGLLTPAGETASGRAIATALLSPFSMGWSPSRYTAEPREVDTVYLGAYRRREMEVIGPFRTQLQANEDYEFNIRLRKAGKKIWCDPAIRSQTFTRPSLRALAGQYLRYGYWKARVARMHPRFVRPRHLAAPAFILALLAGLVLWAAGVAWEPFVLLTVSYLAGDLYFAWRGRRGKDAVSFWRVAAAFAVMHFCWGVGFLAGVLPALAGRDR